MNEPSNVPPSSWGKLNWRSCLIKYDLIHVCVGYFPLVPSIFPWKRKKLYILNFQFLRYNKRHSEKKTSSRTFVTVAVTLVILKRKWIGIESCASFDEMAISLFSSVSRALLLYWIASVCSVYNRYILVIVAEYFIIPEQTKATFKCIKMCATAVYWK